MDVYKKSHFSLPAERCKSCGSRLRQGQQIITPFPRGCNIAERKLRAWKRKLLLQIAGSVTFSVRKWSGFQSRETCSSRVAAWKSLNVYETERPWSFPIMISFRVYYVLRNTPVKSDLSPWPTVVPIDSRRTIG